MSAYWNARRVIRVGNRHPLREAAEVPCATEARQTTGSTVLLPFA